MSKLVIHTDGGARGNPGLAGVGVFIKSDTLTWRHGRVIGEATNNIAEYQAVLDSLALISLLHSSNQLENGLDLEYFLDSELVVRQINGQYKVKDQNLKQLHQQILAKLIDLSTEGIIGQYQFGHVRREQNKEADALYNAALDGDQAINLLAK